MTCRLHRVSLKRVGLGAILLLTWAASAAEQVQAARANKPDLGWMRGETIASASENTAAPIRVRRVTEAVQFDSTLRIAFPQRQWTWRDHGRFWSVPQLAEEYLSTSITADPLHGSSHLHNSRYVTTYGCLRHVCGENGGNGLLWADISPGKSSLIFVASYLVPVSKGPAVRLWFFTSQLFNWQRTPSAFLTDLHQWLQIEGVPKASDVLLVTIVQPTGEQVDIDLNSLQAATDVSRHQDEAGR